MASQSLADQAMAAFIAAGGVGPASLADLAFQTGSSGGGVQTNPQTVNYVLVLSDANKVVEMNLAGANTLTIPPNSAVAFPIGTVIEVFQAGAGQTTLTPGAGVTFRSDGGLTKTSAQYATVGLRKRATDEWVLSGDLA